VTALRWLAFGDLDSAVWGVAWLPGDAGAGHAVLAAGADTGVVAVELAAGSPGDDWRLRAEGIELTFSPAGETASGLVHARGRFTGDGGEHQVDAPGWVAAISELPAAGELDSLRLITAWFGDDEGVALLALRPRKARGQESDDIFASLTESAVARSVADPRLSTTYNGDGVPARAGIELWVSEPGEDPEAPTERPLRLAGEAAGAPAAFGDQGLDLRAQPFRWHGYGRNGTGVYLLGRPA
jgi:hypothetical protein